MLQFHIRKMKSGLHFGNISKVGCAHLTGAVSEVAQCWVSTCRSGVGARQLLAFRSACNSFQLSPPLSIVTGSTVKPKQKKIGVLFAYAASHERKPDHERHLQPHLGDEHQRHRKDKKKTKNPTIFIYNESKYSSSEIAYVKLCQFTKTVTHTDVKTSAT